jgi:hypothetical protein
MAGLHRPEPSAMHLAGIPHVVLAGATAQRAAKDTHHPPNAPAPTLKLDLIG